MVNPRSIENLIPVKPAGEKSLIKIIGVKVSDDDYQDFKKIPKDIRNQALREFICKLNKKYREKGKI